MDKLTFKQKKFVQEYVKTNGNGVQSALRVYDTNKPEVANAISSENLQKPSVQEELKRILSEGNLKLTKITSRLSQIIDEEPSKGFSGSDVIQAINTGLKLHGVLVNRKQTTTLNIDANLNDLSKHELIQLYTKKRKETDDILEGEV
jgi:phage terminase small subunit